MPFQTLNEAERAAVEVARTDLTAKLCSGIGIAQELSTGLYRLITAPREQSPDTGTIYINIFGHEERLVEAPLGHLHVAVDRLGPAG